MSKEKTKKIKIETISDDNTENNNFIEKKILPDVFNDIIVPFVVCPYGVNNDYEKLNYIPLEEIKNMFIETLINYSNEKDEKTVEIFLNHLEKNKCDWPNKLCISFELLKYLYDKLFLQIYENMNWINLNSEIGSEVSNLKNNIQMWEKLVNYEHEICENDENNSVYFTIVFHFGLKHPEIATTGRKQYLPLKPIGSIDLLSFEYEYVFYIYPNIEYDSIENHLDYPTLQSLNSKNSIGELKEKIYENINYSNVGIDWVNLNRNELFGGVKKSSNIKQQSSKNKRQRDKTKRKTSSEETKQPTISRNNDYTEDEENKEEGGETENIFDIEV